MFSVEQGRDLFLKRSLVPPRGMAHGVCRWGVFDGWIDSWRVRRDSGWRGKWDARRWERRWVRERRGWGECRSGGGGVVDVVVVGVVSIVDGAAWVVDGCVGITHGNQHENAHEEKHQARIHKELAVCRAYVDLRYHGHQNVANPDTQIPQRLHCCFHRLRCFGIREFQPSNGEEDLSQREKKVLRYLFDEESERERERIILYTCHRIDTPPLAPLDVCFTGSSSIMFCTIAAATKEIDAKNIPTTIRRRVVTFQIRTKVSVHWVKNLKGESLPEYGLTERKDKRGKSMQGWERDPLEGSGFVFVRMKSHTDLLQKVVRKSIKKLLV